MNEKSDMKFGSLPLAYKNDEKFCDKHQISFIKSPKLVEPVCPKCEKEVIDEQHQKHVDAMSKAIDERRRLFFLEDLSMYDQTLKNASFDNFDTPSDMEAHKLKWAKVQAKSWLDGGRHNIILRGEAGTGKSHLAMSMIKGLSKATGKKAIFANVPTLINKVAEDNFAKKEYYIEQLIKIDYLVLDDLGKENKSNMAKLVIYSILNGRSNTIITTNLTDQELKIHYGNDDAIITRIKKGIEVGSGNELSFDDLKNKRGIYF